MEVGTHHNIEVVQPHADLTKTPCTTSDGHPHISVSHRYQMEARGLPEDDLAFRQNCTWIFFAMAVAVFATLALGPTFSATVAVDEECGMYSHGGVCTSEPVKADLALGAFTFTQTVGCTTRNYGVSCDVVGRWASPDYVYMNDDGCSQQCAVVQISAIVTMCLALPTMVLGQLVLSLPFCGGRSPSGQHFLLAMVVLTAISYFFSVVVMLANVGDPSCIAGVVEPRCSGLEVPAHTTAPFWAVSTLQPLIHNHSHDHYNHDAGHLTGLTKAPTTEFSPSSAPTRSSDLQCEVLPFLPAGTAFWPTVPGWYWIIGWLLMCALLCMRTVRPPTNPERHHHHHHYRDDGKVVEVKIYVEVPGPPTPPPETQPPTPPPETPPPTPPPETPPEMETTETQTDPAEDRPERLGMPVATVMADTPTHVTLKIEPPSGVADKATASVRCCHLKLVAEMESAAEPSDLVLFGTVQPSELDSVLDGPDVERTSADDEIVLAKPMPGESPVSYRIYTQTVSGAIVTGYEDSEVAVFTCTLSALPRIVLAPPLMRVDRETSEANRVSVALHLPSATPEAAAPKLRCFYFCNARIPPALAPPADPASAVALVARGGALPAEWQAFAISAFNSHAALGDCYSDIGEMTLERPQPGEDDITYWVFWQTIKGAQEDIGIVGQPGQVHRATVTDYAASEIVVYAHTLGAAPKIKLAPPVLRTGFDPGTLDRVALTVQMPPGTPTAALPQLRCFVIFHDGQEMLWLKGEKGEPFRARERPADPRSIMRSELPGDVLPAAWATFAMDAFQTSGGRGGRSRDFYEIALKRPKLGKKEITYWVFGQVTGGAPASNPSDAGAAKAYDDSEVAVFKYTLQPPPPPPVAPPAMARQATFDEIKVCFRQPLPLCIALRTFSFAFVFARVHSTDAWHCPRALDALWHSMLTCALPAWLLLTPGCDR